MNDEMLAVLGNPLLPERPPFRREGDYLICTVSGTGFPIVDGIPQLLPENAIPKEELQKLINHE
jgi:uncharacterized protein YbaR (Trm112 family)